MVFVTDTVGVCDRTADVNPIIEITSAYKSLIIFVIFFGNKVSGLPSVNWMCINGVARIVLRRF